MPSAEEDERSLCQESRERSPSLGKLDESSRRGRQHSPRRSQTFLSRRGCGRRGPLAAAMVPTGARPEVGPRYAGTKHGSEPRPSTFHGAAAWAPRAATPPLSSLGHIAAEGRIPPGPVIPHHSPQLETTGAATGTGAGQGGGCCQRRSRSSPPGQLPAFRQIALQTAPKDSCKG